LPEQWKVCRRGCLPVPASLWRRQRGRHRRRHRNHCRHGVIDLSNGRTVYRGERRHGGED
jgi:hypothetical protein